MMQKIRHSEELTPLWRILPVLSVAALGVGLLIAGLTLRTADGAWGGALVVLQSAVLWFRDRFPRLCLLLTTALDLGSLAISSGETSVGMIGVMIAAYSMRRRVEGNGIYIWIAAAALVSTVVNSLALATSTSIPQGWVIWAAGLRAVLAFALPLLLAEITESRSRLLAALRERAELADREREHRAIEAVQQERSLIARELHDIAAHHLSGIIVGAQAAGALVSSDPDQARNYIRRVSRDAQLTLTNLRLTVGLLRVQEHGERSPLPSIAQIPELIDDLRARGRAIEFHQSGEPVALGPVAEISAYRMVQESLANAQTHAPGAACEVTIRYTDEGTRIAVLNTASTKPTIAVYGGGYGIIGMEERATLIHGRLRYGQTPDGGWRNDLFIPAPEASAADTDTDTDTDTDSTHTEGLTES